MTAPDISQPTTVPVGPPAAPTPEAIVAPVAVSDPAPTPEPSRLDNLATPHTSVDGPGEPGNTSTEGHLYFDGAGNAFESTGAASISGGVNGGYGPVEEIQDDSEYPPLLHGARNHLDTEPGDHSIPERRKVGNSDVYEMTGNTLFFDAGGARLR